jgi:HEPN domain-containing protein
MRPEAEPWWRQAEADLETARDVLAAGRWYHVSWLAYQAAEKGLKTVYVERTGSLPPRMHNLVHFGPMLGVPHPVASDLGYLNPAFDLARYPDPRSRKAPVDEVTEPVAQADLAAGERIVAWCRRELGL